MKFAKFDVEPKYSCKCSCKFILPLQEKQFFPLVHFTCKIQFCEDRDIIQKEIFTTL